MTTLDSLIKTLTSLRTTYGGDTPVIVVYPAQKIGDIIDVIDGGEHDSICDLFEKECVIGIELADYL